MTANPTPSVQAQISSSNALVLDVQVKNVWNEPVYFMTILEDWYRIRGSTDPTMNLAFVFHGAPFQALLVNGESPDPPPGISLFAPRRPFGYKVASSAVFRNSIQLPLPLLEWYAYEKPKTANTQPEPILNLKYRVEVVRESQAESVRAMRTFPGGWHVSGKEIRLEAIVDLPRPITLLRRLERDFDRPG